MIVDGVVLDRVTDKPNPLSDFGLSVTVVTCAVCELPFTPRRSDARCCSSTCRMRALRERRRSGQSPERQARRSRDEWEAHVLEHAASGWVYLADILDHPTRAEYAGAWHAAWRLADARRISIHEYQFGRPKLLVGPAYAAKPMGRPRTRAQEAYYQAWRARDRAEGERR